MVFVGTKSRAFHESTDNLSFEANGDWRSFPRPMVRQGSAPGASPYWSVQPATAKAFFRAHRSNVASSEEQKKKGQRWSKVYVGILL